MVVRDCDHRDPGSKQALAVPLFEWMAWLGWQGELWSLVLPGVASGLGVIFFTQVFRKVPDELIDLAKVEGLNPVRIFLTLLPLIAPALVTFCFLHFILSWQEHLLPLLMLDDENLTLPIALAKLRIPATASRNQSEWPRHHFAHSSGGAFSGSSFAK